jgi:drug/metabolite transporter (DMT)-like permease
VAEGLVAAGAWGLAALVAANATARIGAYAAVLGSQALASCVLALLAAILDPPMTGLSGAVAVELAAGGLVSLAAWLAYYKALDHGPVSVVAAVGATYGGVAALLAVAVLGEHPGDSGIAGIALTVAGAAALTAGGGHHASGRAGIPLAAASAAAFGVGVGVGAFILGGASAQAGWLPASLITAAASVTALIVAFPFQRRGLGGDSFGPGLAWAAGAGLAEAIALMSIAAGGQNGHVAVTAAVSGLYPAVPLACGLLFGRELPHPPPDPRHRHCDNRHRAHQHRLTWESLAPQASPSPANARIVGARNPDHQRCGDRGPTLTAPGQP